MGGGFSRGGGDMFLIFWGLEFMMDVCLDFFDGRGLVVFVFYGISERRFDHV